MSNYQKIRDSYSEFLQKYHWDYFVTITFRSPRREPYYAMKNVYNELKRSNVRRAFLGVEPHKTGDLHIHGLVSGDDSEWKPEIDLPWEMWEKLFKRFGRCRVEGAKSSQDVSAYCSKYVLKEQNSIVDHFNFFGEPIHW